MTNEIKAAESAAHWLALEGSVCVLSGAAGGIGSAIAQVLGEAGARLALLTVTKRSAPSLHRPSARKG